MSHSEEQTSQNWPDAKKYPQSIRVHFSMYVAIIILVLMATVGLIMSEMYTDVVTRSIVERLLVQARSYSAAAGKHLLSADGPDALMLNNICRRLSDESDDIYWAGIADESQVLVAHTDVRLITSLKALPVWSAAASDLVRSGESYTVSSDTVRINVPIREQSVHVGRLELAASAEPIHQAQTQSFVTIASVTFGVLLLGLQATILLTRKKLKPISTITSHLRQVAVDNLSIDIPLHLRNEFGYLADTLRVMGEKVYQAQQQTIEKDRMTRELEIAREIQGNILPKTFPSDKNFESYGYYQSAKEVGGDYFDFIELDNNRLGFLVADVSGKSLPGMLVMLLTRDMVRQAANQINDPARLLCQINAELRDNIKKGMFVTMFFGILNRTTGEFEFASAGHNPLLHISAENNKIYQWNPKGFPLGLMPSETFDERIEVERLTLKAGDSLVQYSDGINEALSDSGEEFGMDRFLKILEKNSSLSSKQQIDAFMSEHEVFVGDTDQYDDITLMTVRWHGLPVSLPKEKAYATTN